MFRARWRSLLASRVVLFPVRESILLTRALGALVRFSFSYWPREVLIWAALVRERFPLSMWAVVAGERAVNFTAETRV